VNLSYIILIKNKNFSFLNLKKGFFKMGANVKQVILIAISLIVIATILPLAIGLISGAGDVIINVQNDTLADVADPAVITLLTVLLPILAVIGITMYFLPRMTD